MFNVAHYLKRELTGRRVVFNFLFYGSHIGIFAFGWWVSFNKSLLDQKKFDHFLTTAGLETSCRREASITQHAQVFCLVLSRRRIGAGLRRLSDRAPRSAQCHHVCTTQVGVAHAFG